MIPTTTKDHLGCSGGSRWRWWTPYHVSSAWSATPWISAADDSSRTPVDTAAAGAPPLRRPANPAHRRRPAHLQAVPAAGEPVRDRRARPQARTDDEADRVGSATAPRRADRAAQLGRTLSKRAGDVLAYFDRPSTSNGPTEAINGRLEYLCGSARGHRGFVGGGADLAHRPDHRVAGQGALHPP